MGLFSAQLDESMDCPNENLMEIFVMWVERMKIKEDFLDYVVLGTTTRDVDIFEELNNVLADFELNCQDYVSIYTNGTPCLLDVNNYFVRFVKDKT